jgi:hypothetical protein
MSEITLEVAQTVNTEQLQNYIYIYVVADHFITAG